MTKEEMVKRILHRRNGLFVSFAPDATEWITIANELVAKGILQNAPHIPGSSYVRYFINRKNQS